jgi:hypothetical protein
MRLEIGAWIINVDPKHPHHDQYLYIIDKWIDKYGAAYDAVKFERSDLAARYPATRLNQQHYMPYGAPSKEDMRIVMELFWEGGRR